MGMDPPVLRHSREETERTDDDDTPRFGILRSGFEEIVSTA
jgi:hypothetical protein